MSYCLESTTALTALADAVRAKTSTTASLTVSAMASAIDGISTTGTAEIEITGDCSGMFSGITSSKLFPYISTTAITNASSMFGSNTAIESVPFTINLDSSTATNIRSMYSGCENLKTPATINWNNSNTKANSLFFGCYNLREIPSDYFDGANLEQCGQIFQQCFSLREIPTSFTDLPLDNLGSANVWGYYGYNGCYTLDGIENITLTKPANGLNGNGYYPFYNTFNDCHRLKKLTFKEVDGVWGVYNAKLDLSKHIGYATTASRVLNYNSGITADKKVSDSASYALLKNDPDWWSDDIAYSRYNRTSAKQTINSLPTGYKYTGYTSSTTNPSVIIFEGNAGSATDGGAISTLTASEIAVATNKGWTVSLV